MRTDLAYPAIFIAPAILIVSALCATPMALAQTGEFASQVPGSVVHNC